MIITALFTITKLRKQSRCPWINEWIKRMWYICSIGHDSAIKNNNTWPFATTWMNPESIMVSEISQTEKDKCHRILLICGI